MKGFWKGSVHFYTYYYHYFISTIILMNIIFTVFITPPLWFGTPVPDR